MTSPLPTEVVDCPSGLMLTVPDFRPGIHGRVMLTADMVVYTDCARIVTVPAGFSTDFCSIPAAFRPFFHPLGRHQLAGVMHDYLYRLSGIIEGEIFNREECDRLFLLALDACGCNKARQLTMYSAVRLGGHKYWRTSWRNEKSSLMKSLQRRNKSLTPGSR